MIPSGARRKVIPIMLPVNVRSIMPRSVNVIVTTIISNAMPRLGANKTDIIRQHALFLIMLTNLALVLGLYTKAVKEITNVLAKTPVIPTLARQAKSSMPADAVLMITHMVHVADHQVTRRIHL